MPNGTHGICDRQEIMIHQNSAFAEIFAGLLPPGRLAPDYVEDQMKKHVGPHGNVTSHAQLAPIVTQSRWSAGPITRTIGGCPIHSRIPRL